MPTERRAGDQAGFTMVEVLIAMVLLSIGLLGLEALGIGAARLNARAERQSLYLGQATARMEVALRRVRNDRALRDTTETLPDGSQMTTTLLSSGDADGIAATSEQFRVRVKVLPRTGTRLKFTVADTLSLVSNVYVAPPVAP